MSNGTLDGNEDRALSRLHDIFHYHGRSSVVLEPGRGSVSSVNGGGSAVQDVLSRNGDS